MLLNAGPPSAAIGSSLDFLTKLDRHCGHVELAAAFAYACQDVVRQKTCRHVSRDAWDLGTILLQSDCLFTIPSVFHSCFYLFSFQFYLCS